MKDGTKDIAKRIGTELLVGAALLVGACLIGLLAFGVILLWLISIHE